ncbi:sensor histidine kinase [Actinoplanes sp. NPDC051859]|uniref:sensor histidine kinase n=1 Tax=Actinoplanes sp. NPDC051859 TaxID=3363909 RepID=UPI00379AB997
MLWSLVGRYRAVLIDLAAAGTFLVAGSWQWPEYSTGGTIYGLLVGCALMWRRTHPVSSFAAVLVLSLAAVPIEMHDSYLRVEIMVFAVAFSMYSTVVHAARLRAGITAGLLSLAATTAGGAFRTSVEFPDSLFTLDDVEFALTSSGSILALVWAVASLARSRRLYQVRGAEEVAAAERERDQLARIAVAEERTRLARELHDIVAHSLTVMIVHANGGEYALDRDPERARTALRTIGTTGREALVEIKQLVELLRREDSDLDRAPAGLDQVSAVVERARGAGLAVELLVDGTPPEVPSGVALAVYRIVQEALTNTLKHAGPAPEATVRLRYRPEAIELDISDNGSGTTVAVPGGNGLIGMRERARLHGGSFDAGPLLSGGWRVRTRIPLTAGSVAA